MDPIYQSEINRDVPPARPGEFQPLAIGPISVWPPVVLAPMAGVTNYPFRTLCRRYGAGLYVSEMITSSGIVRENPKTMQLAGFGPDESPRSLQIYGIDPDILREAAKRLVGQGRVDHIDMNFGCPVRKVTSKGGGSAIPLKPRLMRRLVAAVVEGAGDIPVTIKFRMGVDEEHMTFRDAGQIGEDEGCAAVAMHARTAAMLYGGEARWDAITELKQMLSIPVLGNGDIWEAHDALRMMRQTGCDGVVVGRGCLGRPWLFRDLADVFEGREPQNPPNFGEVIDLMLEHAELLCAWTAEHPAIRMMRKFTSWYTKSFHGGARLRPLLMKANTLEELRAAVAHIDRDVPFPPEGMRVKRGKTSSQQTVSLPDGYLDDLEDDTPPGADAEVLTSGG